MHQLISLNNQNNCIHMFKKNVSLLCITAKIMSYLFDLDTNFVNIKLV